MPEPTFSDTLPPEPSPARAIAEVQTSIPDSAAAPWWTAGTEATSLDVSEENSVGGLYRVAIGPVNSDYYLRIFTRFETAGRAGASWNWAACLCTLNWMLFRQLWGAAIAYGAIVAGTAFLAWGTARLVWQAQDVQQWLLALALLTAACVIPGAWGNAWLYARYRQRLDGALAATATVPEAMLLLNRQASSRQGLAWLALGNAGLAGAALGVWIAFPHGMPSKVVAPAPAPAPAAASAPTVGSAPMPAASVTASAPAAAAASVASAASEPMAVASAPASTPSAPAAPAAPAASAASAASATPAASAASAASAREMVVQSASAPSAPQLPSSAPTQVAPRSASPASAPVAPPPSVAALAGSAPRSAASAAASRVAPAAAPPASRAAMPASTLAAKGYYINVGLFAQENNARNARDKLKAAGLAVFTEDLPSKNGNKRTRVRVGPFDTLADADTAVKQIRALGLDALVFRQ